MSDTGSQADPADELNSRYQKAWRLFEEQNRSEADSLANELILEPCLSHFRKACMHLILVTNPCNSLQHTEEAIRLFNEALLEGNFTNFKREHIVRGIQLAEQHLYRVRIHQAALANHHAVEASSTTQDQGVPTEPPQSHTDTESQCAQMDPNTDVNEVSSDMAKLNLDTLKDGEDH